MNGTISPMRVLNGRSRCEVEAEVGSVEGARLSWWAVHQLKREPREGSFESKWAQQEERKATLYVIAQSNLKLRSCRILMVYRKKSVMEDVGYA